MRGPTAQISFLFIFFFFYSGPVWESARPVVPRVAAQSDSRTVGGQSEKDHQWTRGSTARSCATIKTTGQDRRLRRHILQMRQQCFSVREWIYQQPAAASQHQRQVDQGQRVHQDGTVRSRTTAPTAISRCYSSKSKSKIVVTV